MSAGSDFKTRLRAYGCSDVIRLDEALSSPSQLEYLDLLPKRGSSAPPPINAVAEHQGTALLYLVDGIEGKESSGLTLAQIQKQLANRSDPAWLGIVRPGSLEIHPIGFHESSSTEPIARIQESDTTAPLFFQSLVHGTFAQNKKLRGSDYVFREIFGLLTQTTNEFVPKEGGGLIAPLKVLSMAGRALFFRFLIDRRIVKPEERGEICPAATELKDAFSNALQAAQTSAWLDETFNGDFLQIIDERIPSHERAAREAAYLAFYEETHGLVGDRIFDHLQAILRGWHAVPGGFQPELDWDQFDFAHIPVGVLSQVYESFSHRADPKTAKQTSVHYTPRSIAALMVDQSFAALPDKSKAQVLDPSCGAGIFLVLAFRRLVREKWEHGQERPKTRDIQDILYKQLRGFDVSESALRLAALALYITAIELNASPHPPKNLKFPKNLRGQVLFRFGGKAASENSSNTLFSLGSLGAEVPLEFNQSFDVVIGNPPWTRLRDEESLKALNRGNIAKPLVTETSKLNQKFTEIGRSVLKERGFDTLAKKYENPDKNPDVPFLWRATQWAKESAVIAFAMPARIFGRTAGKGFEAWRAILQAVEVTGLVNGADLRKTAVWDDIDMPFSVLFLRNRVPRADHRIYYSAPMYDPALNGHARYRIDYENTYPISIARIQKQPWVLKTLSLGTWLDVEVVETLLRAFPQTLGAFWKGWNRTLSRTGKGYTLADELEQSPADFLADLKDFRAPETGFSVNLDDLHTFKENYQKTTVYSTKGAELYEPPLVVIPKAPGDEPERPRAFIVNTGLAFSQSYYGYSCNGHPEKETLTALIYLLAHSALFRYFSLMVSVSQGADHMIFTKQDFDALPFPDPAGLSDDDKSTIRLLAQQIEHDYTKPWATADAFIFRLYGLTDDFVQVVNDTLFASVSYRKAGRAGLHRTTRETRNEFIAEVKNGLEPYFDVCGQHVSVGEADFQSDDWSEPWFFLAVSREGESVEVNAALLRKSMEVANRRGTSRIIVRAPGGRGLFLGLLNQRRWWTKTRARLCSQHIIREQLSAFRLASEEA